MHKTRFIWLKNPLEFTDAHFTRTLRVEDRTLVER